MWPPAARWRDHVFAFLVRDTRGCALEAHEQLNRFPAHTYCAINWMLEGESVLIERGGEGCADVLPRHMVHGCQSRPVVSRNRGDRHSFCAVFYPDAFHALFGVDLARIHDVHVDAPTVLPPHGMRLVHAVADADSDDERRRIIHAFLAAHATSLDTSPWMRLRRMGVNVGLHVAGSLLGVGPRQVQRLARREGGMNVPGLSRLWRSERSLRLVRETLERGEAVNWAAHAAELGYADQSHLVRECKEASGRTPAQIAQQARHDEADWFYRL
jgi:AraC-like DNA-binding protein